MFPVLFSMVFADEFVIFDPALALPTYIVTFQLIPSNGVAFNLAPLVGPSRMTTIRENQYPIGSQEDNVFHVARSQYLRLTNWVQFLPSVLVMILHIILIFASTFLNMRPNGLDDPLFRH